MADQTIPVDDPDAAIADLDHPRLCQSLQGSLECGRRNGKDLCEFVLRVQKPLSGCRVRVVVLQEP